MTTFNKTLLALATSLPLLATSLPSQAAMSPDIEKALIEVCKAAKSNSLLKLKSITQAYQLKNKPIALKLVCNGEDVISFAESNGADKTAAKLRKSIGNVDIIDVAALSTVKFTF
jgi:hypothetical protein